MPSFSGRVTDGKGNAIEGVEGTYSVATDRRSWEGGFSLPIADPGSEWMMTFPGCLLIMGDGVEYPIAIKGATPANPLLDVEFQGRGGLVPPA